jgi:uncharacterized membrane protein YeaQ/YmgE (transglycosylase-associated protein family)
MSPARLDRLMARSLTSEGLVWGLAEGIVIFGYSIIGAIIVGLILGVLAKFILPGR